MPYKILIFLVQLACLKHAMLIFFNLYNEKKRMSILSSFCCINFKLNRFNYFFNMLLEYYYSLISFEIDTSYAVFVTEPIPFGRVFVYSLL